MPAHPLTWSRRLRESAIARHAARGLGAVPPAGPHVREYRATLGVASRHCAFNAPNPHLPGTSRTTIWSRPAGAGLARDMSGAEVDPPPTQPARPTANSTESTRRITQRWTRQRTDRFRRPPYSVEYLGWAFSPRMRATAWFAASAASANPTVMSVILPSKPATSPAA